MKLSYLPKTRVDDDLFDSDIFVYSEERKDKIVRALKKGVIRKLAPKLYTTDLKTSPELIIKQNIWIIISLLAPGALISDRTALESKPTQLGFVFITSKRKRDIRLLGFTIKTKAGVKPLATDREFINGLFLASPARAFLENYAGSRVRKHNESKRTLEIEQLEDELEKLLQTGGEAALNKIREEARQIYRKLKLTKAFKALDSTIGALLSTKEVPLRSKAAIARKNKLPYEARRVELFEKLKQYLESTYPVTRVAKKSSKFLPFFEAYFSNFIEGTEFEVKEASQIIFDGKIPAARPQDAHDIFGTYQIVSNRKLMSQRFDNEESFIESLKECHAMIMALRPEKEPGKFKSINNRAGMTEFVAPDLVLGTLLQGYRINNSLIASFHRAVFTMFFLSEVHPFLDGNGRIARIFMNIELGRSQEERIIIPTILRAEYISALKALSHSHNFEPIIKVFDFAQKFVASIDWSDLRSAEATLKRCNAFVDSLHAEREGIRLKLAGF